MKHILYIIILSLSFSSYAQTLNVNGKAYRKGDRIQTANLIPYEGTWVWKKDNQSVSLRLYKGLTDLAGNKDFTIEVLFGQYQLTVDNITKYNSINSKSVTDIAATQQDKVRLIFYFTDGITKSRGKGILELLKNGKLYWHIESSRARNWKLTKDQIMSFSMPTDMILSKN